MVRARRQQLCLSIDPYYKRSLAEPITSGSSPSPSFFSFSPPSDDISSHTPSTAEDPEPHFMDYRQHPRNYSMYDTRERDEDSWRLCYVLCLYDYASSDPDHLSFRANELLEIVKMEASGWWAALRGDRIGWIPSGFVVQLTDSAAEVLRSVTEDQRIVEFDENVYRFQLHCNQGIKTAPLIQSSVSMTTNVSTARCYDPSDQDHEQDRQPRQDNVFTQRRADHRGGEGNSVCTVPRVETKGKEQLSQKSQSQSDDPSSIIVNAADSDYDLRSTPSSSPSSPDAEYFPDDATLVDGASCSAASTRCATADRIKCNSHNNASINPEPETVQRIATDSRHEGGGTRHATVQTTGKQQQNFHTSFQGSSLACPRSPSTPMPVPVITETPSSHPVNSPASMPKITPFIKSTPPTPLALDASATSASAPSSPSFAPASLKALRVSLARGRSGSAPVHPEVPDIIPALPRRDTDFVNTRSARRRPIMLAERPALSRLSAFLDAPPVNISQRDSESSSSASPSPLSPSDSALSPSSSTDSPITTPESAFTRSPVGSAVAHDSWELERRSPFGRRSDKIRQLTGDKDAQAFHNARQAQAAQPWYLRPSYTVDDIKLEYDGTVRAGTLSALVERLTVDPLKMTQENSYRHAFLATFSTFTTADQLFDLLVERYEMDHPSELSDTEFQEWKEKKLRPVQKRVLTILSMWLDEHGMAFDDPNILGKLRDFLSLIKSPPSLALTAKLMIQSIERKSVFPITAFAQNVSTTPSKKRSKQLRSHRNELLRIDPVELAAQLTLYEYQLYSRVRPRECLQWSKKQSGNEVTNLAAFCATHDRLASWVKTSILSHDGLGRRADTIDFWIRVAEKCRSLNNFSSLTAIVASLQSAVLTRLHLTWAHVGRSAHLEPLTRMNEPSGNFSIYRNTIHSIDGPCIPFIGVFLTDIVHIQDQLQDTVSFVLSSAGPAAGQPISEQGPPLINFVKRMRFHDSINAILRFQGKAYPDVAEIPSIFSFVNDQLSQASNCDPSWFWTRCQELQTNEIAHADIRKGLEAAGF